MTWLRSPRDVRTRLLLVVLVTLVVALAAATAIFYVLLARSTAHSVDALLRQRVESERATLAVVNGHIQVSETTGDALADGRVWIYRGRQPVEAPQARPATRAAVRSLVGGPTRFLDVPSTDERLFAAPVSARGRRVGTIVAGLPVAPYEQARRDALIGSIVFAAALLGAVGVAVWWLLRMALRPVERMTTQAAAWSERDLDRRFNLGDPHDELTRLAATLDGLLDRIAASLRHERRFSAELSHEIRTPLSKVIAEAEIALRRDRSVAGYKAALDVVLRNAQQVARTVDALLAAARYEAAMSPGTADARTVAEDVAGSVAETAKERGIVIAVRTPNMALRIGVDADLAARALQPVVENACRYGRSAVTIQVARTGSSVRFLVCDDGRGVEADEVERVFEPGYRGRASNGTAGAGLGLSLARRIARTISGDVTVVRSDEGAAFAVSLPTA